MGHRSEYIHRILWIYERGFEPRRGFWIRLKRELSSLSKKLPGSPDGFPVREWDRLAYVHLVRYMYPLLGVFSPQDSL